MNSLLFHPHVLSTIKEVELFPIQGVRGEPRILRKDELILNEFGEEEDDDDVMTAEAMVIAAKWHWMMFTPPYVAQLRDGSYAVIRGEKTVRAALFRREIETLPCMVYQITDDFHGVELPEAFRDTV